MPHTAEHRITDEESLRLRPYQASSTTPHGESPSTHHSSSHKPYHQGSEFYSLPLNREERLATVRLHCCYQFLWTLLILFIGLVPVYNWLTVVVAECLAERENEIIASVFIALLTGFIAIVLAFLNYCTQKSISSYRVRFCAFCFVLFSIVSALNFLIGIYFFATRSCYFFLEAAVNAYKKEDVVIKKIILMYDLKLAGILHLICSVLAFSIGIGFAIIKNNFKYVRQIDYQ